MREELRETGNLQRDLDNARVTIEEYKQLVKTHREKSDLSQEYMNKYKQAVSEKEIMQAKLDNAKFVEKAFAAGEKEKERLENANKKLETEKNNLKREVAQKNSTISTMHNELAWAEDCVIEELSEDKKLLDTFKAAQEYKKAAMCTICLSEEKSIVMIPCGHCVACSTCWRDMCTSEHRQQCAICRGEVTGFQQLYR